MPTRTWLEWTVTVPIVPPRPKAAPCYLHDLDVQVEVIEEEDWPGFFVDRIEFDGVEIGRWSRSYPYGYEAPTELAKALAQAIDDALHASVSFGYEARRALREAAADEWQQHAYDRATAAE